MQSDIIVMCQVIYLTTNPKYQLNDIATADQVTEALEEVLAKEYIRLVLDWHSMMMRSYLLIGCFLIHVIPLVLVRIQISSRIFGVFAKRIDLLW